jgi:signal transduction histidine kinase
MHVGDIVGDTIGDTIAVAVTALNKQHVTRDHTHLLAESAGSLLNRMQRPHTFSSVNRVAAGLESSAICQWVVDLTYRLVKCAYVGIAQICDTAQTPEPLAEVGRSAPDRREWWEHVQHALCEERGEQAADTQLTEDPLIVQLPPQRTRPGRHAHNGRIVCAVPIRAGGNLDAIFAVEARGSAPMLPADVVMLVRAMASTAAKTLEALPPKPAWRVRGGTKALHAALEEMDGALSWVSHELNSPLTVIKMSVQLVETMMERLALLITRSPGIERLLASIQDLLAQAQRNVMIEERLARDLVEATRIRSAKMTLRPRRHDLGQIVQDSVGAQRVMSPCRTIDLEMADNGIPVHADSERVAQVVSNFLGNAVKYSPDDKPVEVRVEVLKTNARVSVRDAGPGLKQSERKRVWQRFYRAKEAPDHRATGGGLGLGLYIGREIIRAHGGRVGVTSVPGHGATFWFTLPLATIG